MSRWPCGPTAGTYTVAATLVAAEDASVGNDALDYQVTTAAPGTAPPPASVGNGGGGGGSLGSFGVGAFLALLLARSSRSRPTIRTGSP